MEVSGTAEVDQEATALANTAPMARLCVGEAKGYVRPPTEIPTQVWDQSVASEYALVLEVGWDHHGL